MLTWHYHQNGSFLRFQVDHTFFFKHDYITKDDEEVSFNIKTELLSSTWPTLLLYKGCRFMFLMESAI